MVSPAVRALAPCRCGGGRGGAPSGKGGRDTADSGQAPRTTLPDPNSFFFFSFFLALVRSHMEAVNECSIMITTKVLFK